MDVSGEGQGIPSRRSARSRTPPHSEGKGGNRTVSESLSPTTAALTGTCRTSPPTGSRASRGKGPTEQNVLPRLLVQFVTTREGKLVTRRATRMIRGVRQQGAPNRPADHEDKWTESGDGKGKQRKERSTTETGPRDDVKGNSSPRRRSPPPKSQNIRDYVCKTS